MYLLIHRGLSLAPPMPRMLMYASNILVYASTEFSCLSSSNSLLAPARTTGVEYIPCRARRISPSVLAPRIASRPLRPVILLIANVESQQVVWWALVGLPIPRLGPTGWTQSLGVTYPCLGLALAIMLPSSEGCPLQHWTSDSKSPSRFNSTKCEISVHSIVGLEREGNIEITIVITLNVGNERLTF